MNVMDNLIVEMKKLREVTPFLKSVKSLFERDITYQTKIRRMGVVIVIVCNDDELEIYKTAKLRNQI